MDKSILTRFLGYVRIDTQSDATSPTAPSTKKQYDLLNLLEKQLKELGLSTHMSEYGVLYGYLDGEEGLDAIGLCSHVDTASELTGKNVNPRLIENYDGGRIILNEEYSMSPEEFPSLKGHEGDTLVVTDGTTLLGGDDKSGIAIIMEALQYYHDHPEVKHHPIRVCFTPDEEIGRGADHFDAKLFKADYAYTIDGDYPEDIAYDNFNAEHCTITFKGVTIHPGEAKDKMVNAARLACELDGLLDQNRRPEKTEGREGFTHLVSISGSVDSATMDYILRNHEASILNEQKQDILHAIEVLKKKYPTCEISAKFTLDYRNMKEKVMEDPRCIEHADEVYKHLGIAYRHPPIRGGTDGANFSFKGCITPNLGTGSYNHHGRFEFLSLRDFATMVEIVKEILKA